MSTDNNNTNNVKGINENTVQSGTSKNRKKRDSKPEKTNKKTNSKLQFGTFELTVAEEPALTKRPKLDTSGTKSGSPSPSQKSLTKEEIDPIDRLNLEIANDHLLKEMESLRQQLRQKDKENEKNA